MSSMYKRSDQAIFCAVGSDIVALNVQRGQCYGMEKVTATVWDLLAEPTDIEGICGRLLALYDVDPVICRADVGKLIDQFREEGLVETVSREN